MTANKPMTGEQLDELMTVAVNMQRDSEKAGDRPTAMFAYAVQVAVLEIRKVRTDCVTLAVENAGLKAAIETHKHGFVRCNCCGDELMCHTDDVCRALDETPATDDFIAEVRASAIEELMEKSLWDTANCLNGIGAFDKANDRKAVQGIIRDELKERVTEFAAQLRKGVQS